MGPQTADEHAHAHSCFCLLAIAITIAIAAIAIMNDDIISAVAPMMRMAIVTLSVAANAELTRTVAYCELRLFCCIWTCGNLMCPWMLVWPFLMTLRMLL